MVLLLEEERSIFGRWWQIGLLRQPLYLGAKLINILKTPVNRSEAYISDLIQTCQGPHHCLTDITGRHLALAAGTQAVANLLHSRLDLLCADRPFLQCPQHAGTQLVLVERLPRTIGLHYPGHHQLGSLISGEAFTTGATLAAATHLITLRHQAGIGHTRVIGATERTVHQRFSSTKGINTILTVVAVHAQLPSMRMMPMVSPLIHDFDTLDRRFKSDPLCVVEL